MPETLMTVQGEALLKSNETPWNIYPRPQMKRDSFLNLNGFWEFSAGDLYVGVAASVIVGVGLTALTLTFNVGMSVFIRGLAKNLVNYVAGCEREYERKNKNKTSQNG